MPPIPRSFYLKRGRKPPTKGLCHRSTSIETCRRKVRHPTMEAAEAEAVRMELKHGKPMDAYRCLVCCEYHVGSI